MNNDKIDLSIKTNPFHLALYVLARDEQLDHILEIGSAAGTGSTYAITQGLVANDRAKDAQLYCIEINPEQFNKLNSKYQSNPNVFCYNFSTIPLEEFPHPDEIIDFHNRNESLFDKKFILEVMKWYKLDVEHFKSTPEVNINGIQQIKTTHQIDNFDLVLIDGSEFTGERELEHVIGARIIVLDDILTFKNKSSFKQLSEHPDYVLLTKNDYLHGFAVFKKMKSGISTIIHTKNEALNIKDCLESVSWTDEQIVIDMESTDQTTEIAMSMGATVFQHSQVAGAVDLARNYGLKKANYTWTLVLDADERVPESLPPLLESFTKQTQFNGLWLPRKNIFFDEWIKYLYPDYQMRFFKTGTGSWSGKVHEHAQVIGLTTQLDPNPNMALIHYSYHTITEYVERQIRYANNFVYDYKELKLPSANFIKSGFEAQLEKHLNTLKETPMSNSEWVTRNLYLFSQLLCQSRLLEDKKMLTSQPLKKPYVLSGYQFIRNAIKFDYPFKESILSGLDLCDEFIILYAESEDDTVIELQKLAQYNHKIKLIKTDWDLGSKIDGERLKLLADKAQSYCTGDWTIQIQADEVYHESDISKIKDLLSDLHHSNIDALLFNVHHFYQNYQTLISSEAEEEGWYSKCIRLSRNNTLTHADDAWTMVGSGHIQKTEVTIYHYGHVKHLEAMRQKASYMETIYHNLPDNFEICPKGEFKYNRVENKYLIPFTKQHPKYMKSRIAQSSFSKNQLVSPSKEKYKLLIISRFHKLKKGFSITLNEIFKTQILSGKFEIHQLAWHYNQEDSIIDGIHVYNTKEHEGYGSERLKELLYTIQPDIVFLHADPFFFLPYKSVLNFWQGPVVGWFTIDIERDSNPTTWKPIFDRCDKIIAMTKTAQSQIQSTYSGQIDIVPLGVNLEVFKPINEQTKSQYRNELNWGEKDFVFLVVANNFWRKGIEYSVEAFRLFHKKYQSMAKNCYLYLHTDHSFALNEMITSSGISQYISQTKDFDPFKNPLPLSELVKLYQASNVLLMTSLSEGFGMPLLEAQAVGLPILASNNSVIPDVIGNAGLLIDTPIPIVGNNAECVAWLRPPDVHHLVELMFKLVTQPEECKRLGENGIIQASNYSWESIAELLTQSLLNALTETENCFIFEEPTITPV